MHSNYEYWLEGCVLEINEELFLDCDLIYSQNINFWGRNKACGGVEMNRLLSGIKISKQHNPYFVLVLGVQ